MKKKIVHLLLFGWSLLQVSVLLAQEQEQEVCMSCHQYPGLVRQDKRGSLKILHIDEQRFRASSHGSLACQDCHLDVDVIPHVGHNKTDCDSQCHKTKRDRRMLLTISRKEFHAQQQSVIIKLRDQTSCKVCHPIYPHSKEPFVRSFLNMHTSYLGCEVCHIKRSEFDIVTYDWVSTADVVFKGASYGSFYEPEKRLADTPKKSLSRIFPYVVRQGRSEALMNKWDTEKALKLGLVQNQMNQAKMKPEIQYYHREVEKMEQTTACEACHARDGLLNFQALGFSSERAEMLMDMPIGNIIKKYETFYFPKLGAM